MKKLLILICTLSFTSVSCLAQLYPIPKNEETAKMLADRYPYVYYDLYGFFQTNNAMPGTKEYKKVKRAFYDYNGNEIVPLGDYDAVYLAASSYGRGRAYPYISVTKGNIQFRRKSAGTLHGLEKRKYHIRPRQRLFLL